MDFNKNLVICSNKLKNTKYIGEYDDDGGDDDDDVGCNAV